MHQWSQLNLQFSKVGRPGRIYTILQFPPPSVLRVCSNPGQRSKQPFLPPKEAVPLPLVLLQWIMGKCLLLSLK